MYDFINRFAQSDEDIIASLNPILDGPDWRARLDPKLSNAEDRREFRLRSFNEDRQGDGGAPSLPDVLRDEKPGRLKDLLAA